MRESTGKCRVNSVFLGEATINNLGTQIVLEGKYGLAEQSTGTRFGSGTKRSWSQETLKKLTELLDLMEEDIVHSVFEGGAASSSETPALTTTDGVPGI